MSMRSALYVLALGLAITALFVVVAFGAIIVLIYHDRGAGFSYLIGGSQRPRTSKVLADERMGCVTVS